MPIDATSFFFVISLAAVINGLGIVRWLTGFAEYLKARRTVRVRTYWVYTASAAFQFLLHVLFWWTLWSIRGSTSINFLSYLYLLSGPVLLFIGTALLTPDLGDGELDLAAHYDNARPAYSTVLILLWVWAIFASPVLRATFAQTAYLFSAFLIAAIAQRATSNRTAHGVIAVLNWMLFAVFIGMYQMQLGGSLQFAD